MTLLLSSPFTWPQVSSIQPCNRLTARYQSAELDRLLMLVLSGADAISRVTAAGGLSMVCRSLSCRFQPRRQNENTSETHLGDMCKAHQGHIGDTSEAHPSHIERTEHMHRTHQRQIENTSETPQRQPPLVPGGHLCMPAPLTGVTDCQMTMTAAVTASIGRRWHPPGRPSRPVLTPRRRRGHQR